MPKAFLRFLRQQEYKTEIFSIPIKRKKWGQKKIKKCIEKFSVLFRRSPATECGINSAEASGNAPIYSGFSLKKSSYFIQKTQHISIHFAFRSSQAWVICLSPKRRFLGRIKYMKDKKEENNFAFIDGQNLYMGTRSDEPAWNIGLTKFRAYLLRKYNVQKAYYFLGYTDEDNQDLYNAIQEAGFIIVFKKHNSVMIGKKKGNVDSDIIFMIMKKLYKKELFDKIVLVSGDGDYRMLVDFLIEEKRFKKILFPNKQFASSLYKKITRVYFDYLMNIKHLIEFK